MANNGTLEIGYSGEKDIYLISQGKSINGMCIKLLKVFETSIYPPGTISSSIPLWWTTSRFDRHVLEWFNDGLSICVLTDFFPLTFPLDSRRVAVRVPHRFLGALRRRRVLWALCIGWKTAMGRPRADQRGEMWLHWRGRARRGDGWHHSELRCIRRRSCQVVRRHHTGERWLGCELGEDGGIRPGRSTGRRLWLQAGGILLEQNKPDNHWHMSTFIFWSDSQFSCKIKKKRNSSYYRTVRTTLSKNIYQTEK